MIVSNPKNMSEEDGKRLAANIKTFLDNIPEFLKNNDTKRIYASPKIKAGINIHLDDTPETFCVYDSAKTLTDKDKVQQINRNRNATTIHLYMK